MRELIWKITIIADGVLAFFFVSQFDVDDMIGQYIGAMVCIVTMLFLLAIGWNYIKQREKEDSNITSIWEYRDDK